MQQIVTQKRKFFEEFKRTETALVLFYLLSMSDDQGVYESSIRKISEDTGIGVWVVRNAIDELKAKHTLNTVSTHRGMVLTIDNYSSYTTSKHITNTVKTQQEDKNCEDNSSTFDGFWNLYGKKVDRKKSESLWNKLSKKDKIACMEYIPKYKLAQPNIKFRRDPTTFIRNRTWENDIFFDTKNPQPQQPDLTVWR